MQLLSRADRWATMFHPQTTAESVSAIIAPDGTQDFLLIEFCFSSVRYASDYGVPDERPLSLGFITLELLSKNGSINIAFRDEHRTGLQVLYGLDRAEVWGAWGAPRTEPTFFALRRSGFVGDHRQHRRRLRQHLTKSARQSRFDIITLSSGYRPTGHEDACEPLAERF